MTDAQRRCEAQSGVHVSQQVPCQRDVYKRVHVLGEIVELSRHRSKTTDQSPDVRIIVTPAVRPYVCAPPTFELEYRSLFILL
jgi:hypothetical protein